MINFLNIESMVMPLPQFYGSNAFILKTMILLKQISTQFYY